MALLIGKPTRKNSKAATMVILLQRDMKDLRKGHDLICIGAKSHYRKSDGTCVHTREVLEKLKPWHRRRTAIVPFGQGKTETEHTSCR